MYISKEQGCNKVIYIEQIKNRRGKRKWNIEDRENIYKESSKWYFTI